LSRYTEDAAAAAAAEAAREVSAAIADFAAGRHRWRALVSAAADLDVLQSFAVKTGPGAAAAGAYTCPLSAQPEPFLTPNKPQTPPNFP